jgi:hypothetical protein
LAQQAGFQVPGAALERSRVAVESIQFGGLLLADALQSLLEY